MRFFSPSEQITCSLGKRLKSLHSFFFFFWELFVNSIDFILKKNKKGIYKFFCFPKKMLNYIVLHQIQSLKSTCIIYYLIAYLDIKL